MRPQYSIGIGRSNSLRKRTWKERLRDWLNSGEEKMREEMFEITEIRNSPSLNNDRGISFKVYKASGGTIIETSFYDRQKDREITSLHVITEDKDIGVELGKIITMETLKL
jgi:hypothetical protein